MDILTQDTDTGAVGLGQGHLGDAFFGEIDNPAVEPARELIGEFQRAAGEPGLGVAGLADVNPVIAGAEPIVASLADDHLGERHPRFVLESDEGRFALTRVVELEARIELGLLRLRLDKRQIRPWGS